MAREDFDKGVTDGLNEPRGDLEKIMDGLGEIVPTPKTEEYEDWARGRDLGEKLAEELKKN